MYSDDGVPIVMLTALPLEYAAVRARLRDLVRRQHPTGTQFEVGVFGSTGSRVAIAEMGDGNVEAGLIAGQAIDMFKPHAVIFVGIAGALRDYLNLGDVVVATRVHAYQGGREDDAGFSARPRSYAADHELTQRARYVARQFQEGEGAPRVHIAPIAAGEILLDSRQSPLAQRLHQFYNDAVAVEMESAGVAQAASISRTRVLTVRGISDRADGFKRLADRSGSQPAAAENAAAFAFAVVDDFLSANDSAPSPIGSPPSGVAPEGPRPGPSWLAVDPPVEVHWRADLWRENWPFESAALELHLARVGSPALIQVRRLPGLAADLAGVGRVAEVFSVGEEVAVDSDGSKAWAVTADMRRAPAGLIVTRSGQRSAWQRVPHDSLGSVLDPAWAADRLKALLLALGALDLPRPDRCAPAVGIAPAASVTLGRLDSLPRHQAMMGLAGRDFVRVPADESVPGHLDDAAAEEVAAELTARLIAAIRRQ